MTVNGPMTRADQSAIGLAVAVMLADHRVGLALKDDPDTFPRVLFQPQFFRLLTHLVLVPAQHVRRGRDSVAEGEGCLEIIDVRFGPGLT